MTIAITCLCINIYSESSNVMQGNKTPNLEHWDSYFVAHYLKEWVAFQFPQTMCMWGKRRHTFSKPTNEKLTTWTNEEREIVMHLFIVCVYSTRPRRKRREVRKDRCVWERTGVCVGRIEGYGNERQGYGRKDRGVGERTGEWEGRTVVWERRKEGRI